MKFRTWMSSAAMCLFAALAITVQTSAREKITTFDVPGAGTGNGQGTNAIGVNARGLIVGYYFDQNNVSHGFSRCPNGAFTTFDPPGSINTFTFAINFEGAIAGFYYDAENMIHGFLRTPDGTITTFDPPGSMGTIVGDINDFGVIAGYYYDATGAAHGFLRYPNGNFTAFDISGAGTAANQGTFPQFFSALNLAGASTGFYIDASNVYHGFVRAPNGEITTFDVPGAGTGAIQGTYPYSINKKGETIGLYVDTNTVGHGFVRDANGTITTVDVPGAGTGAGTGFGFGFVQGTLPLGNNLEGVVTGIYVDQNNASHGFLRAINGEITTFDVPGAGTGADQGTYATSNNVEGAITGLYIDANNVSHGFLRVH